MNKLKLIGIIVLFAIALIPIVFTLEAGDAFSTTATDYHLFQRFNVTSGTAIPNATTGQTFTESAGTEWAIRDLSSMHANSPDAASHSVCSTVDFNENENYTAEFMLNFSIQNSIWFSIVGDAGSNCDGSDAFSISMRGTSTILTTDVDNVNLAIGHAYELATNYSFLFVIDETNNKVNMTIRKVTNNSGVIAYEDVASRGIFRGFVGSVTNINSFLISTSDGPLGDVNMDEYVIWTWTNPDVAMVRPAFVEPPDITFPTVVTGFNITTPNVNDIINFTGNVTDETALLSANWTVNLTTGTIFINNSVSGTSAEVSNTTILVSGGVLNFTLYVTDTNNNVKQNSTLLTVIDNVPPIVNTTFNITTPNVNDIINFTGNISDETNLLSANWTINLTTGTVFFNYTDISGTTAQISNTTILKSNGVFNFTLYVTDTSNNVKQNSTLITVADTIPPIIKVTFNISRFSANIRINDVVNHTVNATDETGLSFCQFINNQTGFNVITNISVSGTNDTCSNIITITSPFGSVINFTVRVNDTFNNFAFDNKVLTIASTIGAALQGGSANNYSTNASDYLYLHIFNGTDGSIIPNTTAGQNTTQDNDRFKLLDDAAFATNDGDSQFCAEITIPETTNATVEIYTTYSGGDGFRLQISFWDQFQTDCNTGGTRSFALLHPSGDGNLSYFNGASNIKLNLTTIIGVNYTYRFVLDETNNRVNISIMNVTNSSDGILIYQEITSVGYFNYGGGVTQIKQIKFGHDNTAPINKFKIDELAIWNWSNPKTALVRPNTLNNIPETPTIILPEVNDFNNTQPDYPFNVTFLADLDGDNITIFYYVNGLLNQTSSNNVTFNATDGFFILNVSLFDGFDSSSNATNNFTIDTTLPTLAKFNMSNNTVVGFNINLTLNITIQDTNPFNLTANVHNGSNDNLFSAFNDILNSSTTISLVITINTSLFASGNYTLDVNFSDRSTAIKIDDYGITKDLADLKLTYDTAESQDQISVKLKSSDIPLDNFDTEKQFDRYIFWFDFSETTPKDGTLHTYVFKINNKDILRHLPNTVHDGHFITNWNWITFDLKNGAATYSVKQTNDNKYEVTITTTETNLVFNSIGGLNVVNEFFNFQVDNDPPNFPASSINNTLPKVGEDVLLSHVCQDTIGLSTCFLSHNDTGTGVNVTQTTIGNNFTNRINQTFTLTVAASGQIVGTQACANDTFNQFSCSSFLTFRVDDIALPIINGTLNVSTFSVNRTVNATFNVSDDFELSMGQVIITENGATRFFNFTLSGTSDQFSQNFTITAAAGSTINVTGRVNDSFNNFAQNETIFEVTKDIIVTAVNILGNSTILKFNVTMFNGSQTFSGTTTDGSIIFSNVISGIFNFTLESDDAEGYNNLTFTNHDVVDNFQAKMIQAIVYFTAIRRGTNVSIINYNLSNINFEDTLVSNQSNSSGGLRLYLNKTTYNISGVAEDYFQHHIEIDLRNKSTSRQVFPFYDLNVSISIFANFNDSFINGFTISLSGDGSDFSENLSDSNNGNVTFSLGNNTYIIIIDAPGLSPTTTSFVVDSSSTYPNLTFSIGGLNSINFTLFDEVTDTLIVKNATILIIGDTSADNFSTETGKLFVSGLVAGEYRINYDSLKYTKRDHYIDVVNGTNSSVTLYLLSITNGTDITFTVQDESGNRLENSTISLKRFFLSTNSYRTVAMARTNFEGKTIIDVDFNDAFYETFTTFKDFTLSTLGTKIITTTLFLTLDLLDDPFVNIDITDDTTSTISFNNVTETFKYTFTSTKGADRVGLLEVFLITPTSETLVCSETDTTSSGTLLCQVNTTSTPGTYSVRGSIKIGDTQVQTQSFQRETGLIRDFKDIWGNQGIFFGVLVAGTLGLLGAVVSPTVGIVMFIVGIFMINFFGFTLISAGFIGFLMILGIVIILKMKR